MPDAPPKISFPAIELPPCRNSTSICGSSERSVAWEHIFIREQVPGLHASGGS
jgi:hypothetical protein